jgi:hypothetical protein
MARDDLILRAKERAETTPAPNDWGYRLILDPGDGFVGRWRGETTDLGNEGRRIFLFWDADGERCFSRFYAALGREIDRAEPEIGTTIVVYRGDDYLGAQGTGFSFGVEIEPNDAPLPESADDYADEDDSIPF